MIKIRRLFKVHLKSGNILSIMAENLKITHAGNKLTSYNFEGIKKGGDFTFHLDIESIDAITMGRRRLTLA